YDLKPQSSDVQAIDIERGLPATPADVAVVLGVIEYLSDPAAVLKRLGSHTRAVLVSHVTRAGGKYSRRQLQELEWQNHMSAAEFELLLAAAGWTVKARRKTANDRTELWLAVRSDVEASNDFASLSPFPIPPQLKGRKIANLGDGFILQAIERLVGRID